LTVDDRELDEAIADARAELEAGDPQGAIDRLSGVARRRAESVQAREMLVAACLEHDTVESRRYAEELLRELVELEPAEPRHRYQLAELLLRRGFDRYAYEELRALRALAPDHASGYLALTSYHRAQWQRFGGDRDLQAMVAAAERAARLAPSNTQAQRSWVTSLMMVGRAPEARVALDGFLDSHVGRAAAAADPWLHALHGACLAADGDHELAWSAFEHAFDWLPAAERAPFDDLSLLADPYALRRWRDMSPGDSQDYVRTFWKSQDPTPTTPVNERLVEHYRRVTMADVLYHNPRLNLRGFDTARGEMYIRYGAPLMRQFENGYVTNRLVPPAWVHAYRAGDDVFMVTFFDYALSGRFYRSINELPRYADLAAYTIPQDYVHDYPGRWLDHAMALAGFRQSSAATREELYLAVPIAALTGFAGGQLAIDAVAFNEVWEEEARVHELVRIDAAPVAGNDQRALVHQLELPLRPGSYRVSTQISGADPVSGKSPALFSTTTSELTVDGFAPGLALSDLELAFAVERAAPPAVGADGGAAGGDAARFAKGDVRVIPNATASFRDGELLYVYFEIYGLELGDDRAQYELSYRIRPADHEATTFFGRLANAFRNKSFIEAQVREESGASTVHRYLAIDVGSLPADRYRLTLRVTDLVNGATATRRTQFGREAVATDPASDSATAVDETGRAGDAVRGSHR
jgi:GWxTD domain-containing protein